MQYSPLMIQLVGQSELIANRYNQKLNPDHFALGILEIETGVAYNILLRLLDINLLRKELEGRLSHTINGNSNVETLYQRTRKIAREFRDSYQATHHILCAVSELDGTNIESILSSMGFDNTSIKRETIKFVGKPISSYIL